MKAFRVVLIVFSLTLIGNVSAATNVAEDLIIEDLVRTNVADKVYFDLTCSYGTNTKFTAQRAVEPDGVFQPFVSGEIVGVSFLPGNRILWRFDPAALATDQRTFKVVLRD
jgi:hypothetical protein